MFAARESQWTGVSGVCEVAGTVNSKSSATSVPVRVGEENVPAATPLNAAFPFTRNGKLVGPPNAATSGRHSSRLEVESEKRNVEEAAKSPEASIFDAGVFKLNFVNSNESLAPRYFPWNCAVIGNSRAAARDGGLTSKPKAISAFCGEPFQSASTVPFAEPTGRNRPSG